MPKNLDSWCPEIFRGIYIDRVNDDQLRVAPCCQADSKIEQLAGFNFTKSPYLKHLRNEISQGKKPNACHMCWQAESVGHKSRRHSAIEFYQIEYGDERVTLEGLDHSVTWACNLACIMCGPENSSTWANEMLMTKADLFQIGKLFQKQNNFFDNLDTTSLKKVHFNGGEPLLNNDQIGFLERLDSQDVLEDVFISYNTNASIYPSTRLIDFWARTRLVKLFFSIDATEAAFNYIRWPADWSAVENNILTMKQELPSNVMFGFNVTVGTYNIFELKKVREWIDHNLASNREGDPTDFNWQIASNFDPKWLRKDVKKTAIDYLGSDINGLASYLQSYIEYPSSDHWIQALDRIDIRRGTQWKQKLMIGNYYG